MEKNLIKYFKTLGLKVCTNTMARGHLGFFLKNRIDVSKNTPKERIVPVLLHEFAHYIHSKIEPDIAKTGGSLKALFDSEDIEVFEKELMLITQDVDENSKCIVLNRHKNQVKQRIKNLEIKIKEDYPKFMRSKKFLEFEKYIKRSKAKYLLKYDRVKYVTPFLRRVEYYSIDRLEEDFSDMPQSFAAYIRLRSYQKKQSRISAKINKINKYYKKPTELFARFVESLYINSEKTKILAPKSVKRFFELLNRGYYKELDKAFEIAFQNQNINY